MSAAGIPQVTVVHGSSTAGSLSAGSVRTSNILVRGKAKVFLAGPPAAARCDREIATDEELGGGNCTY